MLLVVWQWKVGFNLCVFFIRATHNTIIHFSTDFPPCLWNTNAASPLQTFHLLHAAHHPPGPSYLLQISCDTNSKDGGNYQAFIHPTKWFQNIHSISVKITIRTASLPLQIRHRQAAQGFLYRDRSQIGLVIWRFYYTHITCVLYHFKDLYGLSWMKPAILEDMIRSHSSAFINPSSGKENSYRICLTWVFGVFWQTFWMAQVIVESFPC